MKAGAAANEIEIKVSEEVRVIAKEVLQEMLKRNEKEGRAQYQELHVNNLALAINKFLNCTEYKKEQKVAKLFRENLIFVLSEKSGDDFDHVLFNQVASLEKIVGETLQSPQFSKLLLGAKSEQKDQQSKSKTSFKVCIETLSGAKWIENIDKNDTVLNFRKSIFNRAFNPASSWNANHLRLVCNGYTLEDGFTLDQYGIRENDKVTCILRF